MLRRLAEYYSESNAAADKLAENLKDVYDQGGADASHRSDELSGQPGGMIREIMHMIFDALIGGRK